LLLHEGVDRVEGVGTRLGRDEVDDDGWPIRSDRTRGCRTNFEYPTAVFKLEGADSKGSQILYPDLVPSSAKKTL
jgi:hypothetical protein